MPEFMRSELEDLVRAVVAERPARAAEQRTAALNVAESNYGHIVREIIAERRTNAGARAGLLSAPGGTPGQELTIRAGSVTIRADRLVLQVEHYAPVIHVAPTVEVTVPEAPAPVVTVSPTVEVHVPEAPAPVVNVTVPEGPAPVVQVAAPVVNVTVPEAPAPVVNVTVPPPKSRTVEFTHDRDGTPTSAVITDQE